MAKLGRARQAQMMRASQVITAPQSLPPPLKGWNARDPYESMDPQDAAVLDNWYPDYGGCVSRDGCNFFAATDRVHPVQTLAVWRHGSASALVAASNGNFQDVSAGGLNRPTIGSGFTSNWWAWVNFNGRLFLANGIDPPQVWTGTGSVAAAALTLDTTAGFPANYINALNGVAVRHNRLFFWTNRDCGFWYGPLLGIAGTLSYFDFSQSVPSGAAVIGIDVLTYDGGTGIADYTVFLLSTGEMLTYQGTDPTNPSNWALVGLYTIAAPVGGAEVSGLTSYPNRGYFRYGGDVYVITASDHSKMSQLITALKLGQMPPRSKVSQAVVDAVAAGNELPGWQIIYWGARRRLIFNIPNPDGTFDQHIYNPALDAWARYKGIPAICWAVWQNRLFFGTPQGVVCEHGVGASDILAYQQNTVIPISVYGQQAWNLFETPLEKRVAAIRPVIQAQGDAVAHVSLGFDYGPLGAVTVDVNEAASASPWDTSPWDTSPWSSETAVSSEWHIAGGDGSAISVAVAAYGLKRLTWVRTDFRLEPGKAL